MRENGTASSTIPVSIGDRVFQKSNRTTSPSVSGTTSFSLAFARSK
jgi:hypothetical protein